MTNIFINSYERLEFTKISNSLNLDTQTQEISLKLYQQYIQTSHFITKVHYIYFLNEKLNCIFFFLFFKFKHCKEDLQIIFGSAILIASKTELITTVNGEKKRGIGISFAHIINHLKSLDLK